MTGKRIKNAFSTQGRTEEGSYGYYDSGKPISSATQESDSAAVGGTGHSLYGSGRRCQTVTPSTGGERGGKAVFEEKRKISICAAFRDIGVTKDRKNCTGQNVKRIRGKNRKCYG